MRRDKPARRGFDLVRSDSAAVEIDRTRWPTRLGWGIVVACYLVFAFTTLVTLQSGLHGDIRRTNPDPGPAPYPPFLGFDNWPMVVAWNAVPTTLIFMGAVTWLSIRQRRIHWSVIVAIACMPAGALDPIANWAVFAVFDSRMVHFPFSWPYLNVSPDLEPALSFLGGYASYYLLNGWGLLKGHDLLIASRIRPDSWLGRHRLAAVFLGAFVLAIPVNAFVQFLWLKVRIFIYTEAVGPVLEIGHVHLPLIMVVYDCFIFAMVAVVCVRDDRGNLVLVDRICKSLPHRRGRLAITFTRETLVATTVLVASFAVPLAVLAGLRVAQLSKPSYDEYPFPTVKVYDPYGNLQRAGKPGPFYR
jgi:hypothetical protein